MNQIRSSGETRLFWIGLGMLGAVFAVLLAVRLGTPDGPGHSRSGASRR